jgi:hypothetical protein
MGIDEAQAPVTPYTAKHFSDCARLCVRLRGGLGSREDRMEVPPVPGSPVEPDPSVFELGVSAVLEIPIKV